MFTYVFIAMINGQEIELVADGVSENSARNIAWDKLTDEQKNDCECIDMVEVLA